MSFTSENLKKAQAEVDLFLADVAGVQAIVVATVDGFSVVTAYRQEVDSSRLAAIASSMSAMGEVVALESGLGKMQSVIVDSERGYVLVRGVERPTDSLVIKVLADRSALLGMVLHRASNCAKRLASL